MNWISKSLLSLTCLLVLFSTACAEDPLDSIREMSDRIPMDVSATFHIPDFPSFFEQLREHEAFASKSFLSDLEKLLASKPRLFEDWNRVTLFLEAIREVHVMAWMPEQSRGIRDWKRELLKSQIVVALKVDEGKAKEESLNSLTRFLTHPYGPYAMDDLSDSFHVGSAGGFILIGNSKTQMARMSDSLSRKTDSEEKLSRDRRFASAMIDFRKSENDLVFGFFRPPHFYSMFRVQARVGNNVLQISRPFDSKTIKNLPQVSLTAGIYGQNDDVVVKTRTANTLPSSGPPEDWEVYGPLRIQLPPCDLDVRELFAFQSAVFIKYFDEFGLERTLQVETVADFSRSKKMIEERRATTSKLKTVRLPGPDSDDDAIVWGTSVEERKLQWEALIERINSKNYLLRRGDKKYRDAIKSLGKSIEDVGIGLLDNRGTALTRDWKLTGQVPDIVQFIDNSNADEDAELRLKKISQRAVWLAKQFGREELMRIEAGQNVRRAADAVATGALNLKAGTNSTRTTAFIKGTEYRKWKTDEHYRGNRYTLATWLVWNTALEHCDEMVEIWCVKEPGEKLETAFGFFFKQDSEEE